jgi:hypothetical protein
MLEGCGKFGGGLESGAAEQVCNMPVEAHYPAVGLRASRRDQTVFDAMQGSGSGQRRAARWGRA